ncbi:hypothetical protein GCM10027275_09110 [Rhabdobacter roseus]|uniref:Peptidase M56 domain-containing protein n=1 Tax=Rhabdobacter roseus TaxID=1655419 RepID=A0A840THQ3_9BACT|nr:M56 family metallopeptidase [Rhabdobacter roseus]MBB5282811.1 hypothetical protein [Rhabdobacter roseus]
MILYLLKVTLCSACLLLFYRLVLEREKLLRFKRFFLLGSLVVSVGLPLIPLEILLDEPVFDHPADAPMHLVDGSPVPYTVKILPESLGPKGLPWMDGLGTLYLLVSGVLLVRFGKNISGLLSRARRHGFEVEPGVKVVLLSPPTSPHSFLNCIFLNEADYRQGAIEREILLHEGTHVRQRHSLDVLFIELLKVVFWFNPAFYFYRHAIVLNHEFLADEAVLRACRDVPSYQYLLLQKAIGPAQLPFSSTFNYSFTKKRFIMMTKHTSRTRAWLAQVSVLPLLVVAVFMFSDLSLAQIAPPPPPVEVSGDLVKEYNTLIQKYVGEKGGASRPQGPSVEDAEKMQTLLAYMSEEQKESLEYLLRGPIGPLPRITPTDADYEKYKNPAMYGVWIDNKKVPNTELNKYKASDFSQVFISKLYGNAQKTIGYKYKYQLDLMTTKHYEAYRKEAQENPLYIIMRKEISKPKS